MPSSTKPARATEAKPARASKSGQRRIAPEERARDFVQMAVEFFSEVGFEGGTRELAQRLGVSQPLLYRYFPSKDDLIRAVYKKIYLDRWDERWDEMLADTQRPLRQRLQAFYEDYTDAIFTREWLRIYLFAGLRGVEINHWYITTVEDRILRPMARGVRHELGLPEDVEITPQEVELFWTLHGGIFYYGVRRYIYESRTLEDKTVMIANALDAFLDGAEAVLRRMPALARKPETRKAARRPHSNG